MLGLGGQLRPLAFPPAGADNVPEPQSFSLPVRTRPRPCAPRRGGEVPAGQGLVNGGIQDAIPVPNASRSASRPNFSTFQQLTRIAAKFDQQRRAGAHAHRRDEARSSL